jgi:SAM-dependent methyltransferase
VLDAGCGSGRLTVALALAGHRVTGFDTSAARLEQARARATRAGVELELVEADMDAALPFAAESFDVAVSRLALMIASDPAATLRELARCLVPGGLVLTAVWASPERNPWFAVPRAAVAARLGDERGAFAGAFGRLGAPEVAAVAHREAGLDVIDARVLRETVRVSSGAEHWRAMVRENGHFRRLEASLDADGRAGVLEEVTARLEPYRDGDELELGREMVLVSAVRA